MDRRSFLKVGGGLIFLAACRNSTPQKEWEKSRKIPIFVDSNRKVGHQVRTAISLPVSSTETIDTLVVGGGIAGLAAACSLPSDNYVVCELDPNFGGTSGAISINNQLYSQGAHYDLAYPSHYGKDGLELLQKLNIIDFNVKSKLWEFKDKEYLIPAGLEEACYYNGNKRESVLENTELRQNFVALLKEYEGQFTLPSTLISKELHHLDQLTFYDYLNKYLPIDDKFMESIDYQMLDDWGGTSTQVSALAGIHYYKSRPYYDGKEIELLSPPQGNFYFIQKMMQQLNLNQLKSNHLVFGLVKEKDHWLVDVYDNENSTRKQYKANQVIYAGQKHALKYIHAESYASFSDIQYAPWVVMNIEMEECSLKDSKWQNDFLSPDNTFLGFVDSTIQTKNQPRVLTAYFCFPEVHHYQIEKLEEDANELVEETIEKISLYYDENIRPFVKQVHIKLMGHAMPIPSPNYITKERTLVKDGLAFAGVDSGRFPLMFDAMDSGIQAAKALFDE